MTLEVVSNTGTRIEVKLTCQYFVCRVVYGTTPVKWTFGVKSFTPDYKNRIKNAVLTAFKNRTPIGTKQALEPYLEPMEDAPIFKEVKTSTKRTKIPESKYAKPATKKVAAKKAATKKKGK